MNEHSAMVGEPYVAAVDEAQPTGLSLSEVGAALDAARRNHAAAKVAYDSAKEELRRAAEGERAAYKTFNEAVAAMKPKRKSPTPRPKKDAAQAASKPKKK